MNNKGIENEEIMNWELINPKTNDKIIYANTKKIVVVADIVREEEKKLRIKRLMSKRKKLAFEGERLEKLFFDRGQGMSIRKLASKYNCSTRTIQKYLKKGLGTESL